VCRSDRRIDPCSYAAERLGGSVAPETIERDLNDTLPATESLGCLPMGGDLGTSVELHTRRALITGGFSIRRVVRINVYREPGHLNATTLASSPVKEA